MGYEDDLKKEAEALSKETERLSNSSEALQPIEKKEDKENRKPRLQQQFEAQQAKKYGQSSTATGAAKKVGGGCCGSCGLILFLFIAAMTAIPTIFIEQTAFIDGDTHNFNPTEQLEQVQELAGTGAFLVNIEAQYVRADGTMDLHAEYDPQTTYEFYLPLAETPEDKKLVGTTPLANGRWYTKVEVEVSEPWKNFNVTGISNGVGYEYNYFNLGMNREDYGPVQASPDNIVPAPSCSFEKIWQTAIAQGAPEDAVAMITYDKNGYEFEIRGTSISFEFNQNCEIIRDPFALIYKKTKKG